MLARWCEQLCGGGGGGGSFTSSSCSYSANFGVAFSGVVEMGADGPHLYLNTTAPEATCAADPNNSGGVTSSAAGTVVGPSFHTHGVYSDSSACTHGPVQQPGACCCACVCACVCLRACVRAVACASTCNTAPDFNGCYCPCFKNQVSAAGLTWADTITCTS